MLRHDLPPRANNMRPHLVFSTLQRWLLGAILATVVALVIHEYLPKKKQMIWPSSQYTTSFYSGTLPDGKNAAAWVNQSEHRWRCSFPLQQQHYFPCELNMALSSDGKNGVDFASYRYLRVRLDFSGSADAVQISLRNYNSLYTSTSDPNSSKYMAVSLRTEELNHDLLIGLEKFTVAHWWLIQYRMPLAYIQAEMDNVIGLNINFPNSATNLGEQELVLREIELVGEWISTEDWYLSILLLWLGGICIWILLGFIRLVRKSEKDVAVISELSDSNRRLKVETDKFRRLSTVDPLTQIYNRFGIDQIISNIMSSKESYAEATSLFSLIIIDIDHFKRINDTRGHDSGDLVLQRVAQIISNHVRQQDYVGRWGGEEFLVIQPYTDARDAMVMAEKLRGIIATSLFDPANPLAVTASFGVSEFRRGDDFGASFRRADVALYSSKAAGRNCCMLAE